MITQDKVIISEEHSKKFKNCIYMMMHGEAAIKCIRHHLYLYNERAVIKCIRHHLYDIHERAAIMKESV